MTDAQDRAHFSIWCIMASPLIAGTDLRTMSANTVSILTNKHAIAVNQDELGIQAHLVLQTEDAMGVSNVRPPARQGPATQVWVKRLSSSGTKSAWAVLLLNRISNATTVQLPLSKLSTSAATASFKVLDLWADAKSLGVKRDT
eukprot:SAG31_NODE_16990_length_687_cov_1.423469_1_plen_143_part_10